MEKKRKVLFDGEFESKIKKGVDKLANAVKSTMGPKGKLVLIQRADQHPIVTKDGVTVANSINLIDEVENLGARVIREAAARTAEEAGDGTTTSTVLAQKLYELSMKMKAAGYSANAIKQGMVIGMHAVKEKLSSIKKEVNSTLELNQIALISANGEKEIADLIVGAIESAGQDGPIIVEEAKGFKSSLQTVDGFRVERGFLSPYFVNNKNKMNCEFKKPYVLLADREFNSIHDLMKPLELSLEKSRPILIIANDIEGEALQGLVVNKTKGSLRVCAIKSPGFGNSRYEMLSDLQTVIGGTVLTSDFDMSKFSIDDFGSCEKSIIQKNFTLIVDNSKNEKSKETRERIKEIKNQISDAYSLADGEEELLRYRLRQLSGGISILRVGAATESELIERYDRVDDALHATKAAMQEGILPGGGTALLKCAVELDRYIEKENDSGIRAGLQIVKNSISEPFKQIIKNCNISHDTILSKISDQAGFLGYDSRNDKFGDMFEMGVIDPFKVVRCSIENAISAASMLMMVECCLVDEIIE